MRVGTSRGSLTRQAATAAKEYYGDAGWYELSRAEKLQALDHFHERLAASRDAPSPSRALPSRTFPSPTITPRASPLRGTPRGSSRSSPVRTPARSPSSGLSLELPPVAWEELRAQYPDPSDAVNRLMAYFQIDGAAPSVVSVGLYALGASFWKMRALRAERRKSEAALHMLDLEASAYGAQVARFCALRLAGESAREQLLDWYTFAVLRGGDVASFLGQSVQFRDSRIDIDEASALVPMPPGPSQLEWEKMATASAPPLVSSTPVSPATKDTVAIAEDLAILKERVRREMVDEEARLNLAAMQAAREEMKRKLLALESTCAACIADAQVSNAVELAAHEVAVVAAQKVRLATELEALKEELDAAEDASEYELRKALWAEKAEELETKTIMVEAKVKRKLQPQLNAALAIIAASAAARHAQFLAHDLAAIDLL